MQAIAGLTVFGKRCQLATQPLKRMCSRLSVTVFALTGGSSDSGDPIIGIIYLSCSAIAACSGGETPTLRLTVNYSVP